jgi:hypothetical protein
MQFAARISRVRMKDGADITILPTPMDHGDPEEPENWRGAVIRCAKRVAEFDETHSRLEGFIVLGFYTDGSSSLGFRMPTHIPRCLLPGYVAEILRRDVIVATEAAEEFDRRFEWVE